MKSVLAVVVVATLAVVGARKAHNWGRGIDGGDQVTDKTTDQCDKNVTYCPVEVNAKGERERMVRKLRLTTGGYLPKVIYVVAAYENVKRKGDVVEENRFIVVYFPKYADESFFVIMVTETFGDGVVYRRVLEGPDASRPVKELISEWERKYPPQS